MAATLAVVVAAVPTTTTTMVMVVPTAAVAACDPRRGEAEKGSRPFAGAGQLGAPV
jgi:hypothetical protein